MLSSLDLDWSAPSRPVLYVGLVVVVAVVAWSRFYLEYRTREKIWPQFPMMTVRGLTPKKSFSLYARETCDRGLKEAGGHPFQVMSGSGPLIMLPNKFADEIRNDPRLEFMRGIKQDFFPNYPGFDAFKEGLEPDSVSMEAIHTRLTPTLGLVTEDLVDETTTTLHDLYGESPNWQQISIRDSAMDLVARTSSRVFLGEDLCRNERWIAIAKGYVNHAFAGAFRLRMVPSLLRPIRYWFIPQLTALRRLVKEARLLVDGELAKQSAVVDEAIREGRKPPKLPNTLRWMYEIANGRKVDFTGAQLAFTVVALGAQSALHAQAIMHICDRPELLKRLREEIIQVIGKHGWTNAAFGKLELMDSYVKEIQRLHPANSVSMNRFACEDVPLSDGSVLPKGSRIQVCSDNMNPEIYDHPEEFQPERYLKMRQQPGNGNATKWQLATPQSANMGFGLGRNACPGRFFAVHHIKISLCHMLLKYDWRYVDGAEPAVYDFEETVRKIRNSFKLEYRRRREEINLDIA